MRIKLFRAEIIWCAKEFIYYLRLSVAKFVHVLLYTIQAITVCLSACVWVFYGLCLVAYGANYNIG